MDLGLRDKVAIITGSSRGLGLASAKLLHGNGARIAITGREPDALQRAREIIGGDVVALQTDVLSRDSCRATDKV